MKNVSFFLALFVIMVAVACTKSSNEKESLLSIIGNKYRSDTQLALEKPILYAQTLTSADSQLINPFLQRRGLLRYVNYNSSEDANFRLKVNFQDSNTVVISPTYLRTPFTLIPDTLKIISLTDTLITLRQKQFLLDDRLYSCDSLNVNIYPPNPTRYCQYFAGGYDCYLKKEFYIKRINNDLYFMLASYVISRSFANNFYCFNAKQSDWILINPLFPTYLSTKDTAVIQKKTVKLIAE